MARKDRNKPGGSARVQANAPELQQILQQPAHNPYYPDPWQATNQPSHQAPPPYSESTVAQLPIQANFPMAQANRGAGDGVNYTRFQEFQQASGGRGQQQQQAASVVIHQVPYNPRAERYSRKVRSFNNQLLVVSILAAVGSFYAYGLYDRRPCLFDFTVHKPSKDLKISITDVRNLHINVVYMSALIAVLCLLKSATGYSSKSYSCYLFLTGLLTFFATITTGYLAYLTFYSPCAIKTNEIFTNLSKTLAGSLADSLPSPDRGLFGESNVLQVADEDRKGVLIFFIDVANFFAYFVAFLTATLLC